MHRSRGSSLGLEPTQPISLHRLIHHRTAVHSILANARVHNEVDDILRAFDIIQAANQRED